MSGIMLKYFVLKPKGTSQFAKASRAAMRTFAQAMRGDGPDHNNELAQDVRDWAEAEAILAERPKLEQALNLNVD